MNGTCGSKSIAYKENNTIRRASCFLFFFENSRKIHIVDAVFIIKRIQALINSVLTSFAASGKMGGDGEIASVMGFSGFGMCSPV